MGKKKKKERESQSLRKQRFEQKGLKKKQQQKGKKRRLKKKPKTINGDVTQKEEGRTEAFYCCNLKMSLEDDKEELSDNEFEVEKVLDSRINDKGEREYFLKWKGYPMSECTWENESNMSCDDLVKEYWSRVKKEKGKKSKDKHEKQPTPQTEKKSEEVFDVIEPEKEEEKKEESKEKEKDEESQSVPKVSKGIWWLKDYDEESNDEDDDGVVVYEPEPKKPALEHEEVVEEDNHDVVPPLFDCVVSHRETSIGFDLLVRWFALSRHKHDSLLNLTCC